MRIVALTLCLFCACAVAGAKHPPGGANPADPVVWSKVGNVRGVTGNYTPVVQLGGSQIRVYANTNGSVDGNLYLRVGSWTSVGSASLVLRIDSPRDAYIRTSAVVQGASGTYYALLYTGDGYPTQGGYSPSWATSADGLAWTWHGPIGLFGRNQSSAAALIVDESRSDAYRFMAWIDGVAPGLVMMHSPDGLNWDSDDVNVWPFPGESPQFVTAAKDAHGYHLIGANTFPATALRHLYSCTGLPPWRVLETASDVGTNYKGTNLVYDAPNNRLHALTSGTHFSVTADVQRCP